MTCVINIDKCCNFAKIREIRLWLGNAKINLSFRSPCTNFAATKQNEL